MTSLSGYATVKEKKGMVIKMLEVTKLIQAKDYLDMLVNGIDPTNESEVPNDTIVQNENISMCFVFISEVLTKLIENEGLIGKRAKSKGKLIPFEISDEVIGNIEITESPVMIRQFTDRINCFVDENTMQKLKVTAITGWLVSTGLLCEETVNDKKRKMPTKKGEKAGIYSEERNGYFGKYNAILYKPPAQQHILSNLQKIIAFTNKD